jgi:ATP-dependent helicase HrpA
VIEVGGRTFPVEDIFLPPFEDEELAPHVARAVTELSSFDQWGDILVFLPGEREIRECAEMLIGRNFPHTEVLMLFSRLGTAEQNRVFHPGNLRRIILSTNVAETSLTIPRVKFCIDSGTGCKAVFHYKGKKVSGFCNLYCGVRRHRYC